MTALHDGWGDRTLLVTVCPSLWTETACPSDFIVNNVAHKELSRLIKVSLIKDSHHEHMYNYKKMRLGEELQLHYIALQSYCSYASQKQSTKLKMRTIESELVWSVQR